MLDLASRQTQILTDSSKDESPSFAPNGRMVLYATEVGGRGRAGAGVVRTVVSSSVCRYNRAMLREPAWGPQPRN